MDGGSYTADTILTKSKNLEKIEESGLWLNISVLS